MFKLDKLSGLIIEKYKSKRRFAKEMNLSERTMYLKLQGKIEFKQSEIDKASELLGIKENEIPIYFFNK